MYFIRKPNLTLNMTKNLRSDRLRGGRNYKKKLSKSSGEKLCKPNVNKPHLSIESKE